MVPGEVHIGCVCSATYDVAYQGVLFHQWLLKTLLPDCGTLLDTNMDSAKVQVYILVDIFLPILDSCPKDQNKGLKINPK